MCECLLEAYENNEQEQAVEPENVDPRADAKTDTRLTWLTEDEI